MTLTGGDVTTQKKVTAGSNLTMTATNKLTTADELSAGQNMTLTGGDVTTQKKAAAGSNLTMTATNKLTTADEISAEQNMTLTGGDVTTQKKAAAGSNLTMTATNKLTTADELSAGQNMTLTGGDITTQKKVTAGNNLTLTAANNLTAKETLKAGGWLRALQTGGNGNITLRDIKAGSFQAVHRGKGDIRADNVYAQHYGFVHHAGVGDIHLDTMQVGNTARVRHTGLGDIFTRQLTAGQAAHFLNRHGGMELGVIDGGRRLTILDLSRQAKVRANVLRASELITIFSLHQEIDHFETPTILDLLLAGDRTRRAVGWLGAAEVGSLFETYWRRYDSPDAGPFIDLRPWESAFVQMVQEKGAEEIIIGEDA